jgi:membrane protein YdbS with pleckstrin-like domain
MQLRPSLKFVKLSYVFCLVLAVALAVYIVATKDHPMIKDHPEATYFGFAVPVILALFTVIRHVQRRLVKVTITGDRLRYESGLFSKTTRTIELVKVQDVRVEQSLGQRMVGLGDLSLETAGGTSRIEIDSIDNPQAAADHILALAQAQRAHPQTPDHPGTP